MTPGVETRVTFKIVTSPLWLTLSLGSILFLAGAAAGETPGAALETWPRLAALAPLALLSVLMLLDSIHRVEMQSDGIRVTSLAALVLGRISSLRRWQSDRSFRLSWSAVDAVELRIPRFQSPLRRHVPRGWLLAGSSGRVIRIPLGHPQLPRVLALCRRFVHPFFVHLPVPDWEGKIPSRRALERRVRTIVCDASVSPDYVAETARICLLWGNPKQAERLMDLALASHPAEESLLEDYYRTMKRLNQRDKALSALEKLLALRSSPMDLLEMAEMRHSQGDRKGTTEYLLQAAEHPPSSDLAHFLLGCLYLQREGLEEAALEQWKKGLERARHPQLLAKLVEAYRYHRALLTTPGFFEREHRRLSRLSWGRKLGVVGAVMVLAAIAWWWLAPASADPFPGRSGTLLVLGGLLLIAGAIVGRSGGGPVNGR
jgi:tetratricopeptide (TPR) repeat protein